MEIQDVIDYHKLQHDRYEEESTLVRGKLNYYGERARWHAEAAQAIIDLRAMAEQQFAFVENMIGKESEE